MHHPFVVSSLVAFAFVSAAAMAQERPATEPAAATAKSAPKDCPAANPNGHDHVAERGGARSKTAPCPPADAASGASAKPKPAHDHGKFHKNQ